MLAFVLACVWNPVNQNRTDNNIRTREIELVLITITTSGAEYPSPEEVDRFNYGRII